MPERTQQNRALSPMLACTMALLLAFPGMVTWSPYAWSQSYDEGKQAYLDKDYEKALQILRPLAEQGDSQAQITLGIMYEYGHGVTADPAEALKWFKLAAEQGVPAIQHDIGVKYFQGLGVEQDYHEAARWWELSANAGLADSQFNLGLMYYRGIGIPQDYDRAITLFRAAADQGHAHAQYSLAVMYAFGQGIEKNYDIAIDLFRKSAAQEVVQAQFNLGVFYENGFGVDKDMEKAKEWYQKAASHGLQEAIAKLAEMSSTTEEIPEEEAVPEQLTAIMPTEVETEVQPAVEKSPVPEEQPATVEKAVTGTSEEDLNRNDWLRHQRPDKYTLQLASVVNKKDMIRFLKQHHLGPEAAYIEVVVNGVTRYTAIFGIYDTYEQADLAIKKLSDSIQKQKPWIRNTGILQGLLR